MVKVTPDMLALRMTAESVARKYLTLSELRKSSVAKSHTCFQENADTQQVMRHAQNAQNPHLRHKNPHPRTQNRVPDGGFPFLPRRYKYLALAVGYAKQCDTAIVEIKNFSFHPESIREDAEGVPRFAF